MKEIRNIAFMLALLMSAACSGDKFDYEGMESAEKQFQKRAEQTVLALMPLEKVYPDKDTRALAVAAGKGRVKRIEALVEAGTDVDSRGAQGVTPLFWAFKNYRGFKKLLELGADPNVVFGGGQTILHWATKHRDDRFLRAVLEHGGDPNLKAGGIFEQTPIFDALSRGIPRVSLLLDAGADIDSKDSFGNTPVMRAARRLRYETVYYLLEKGADYSITNDHGQTLAAIVRENLELVDPKSSVVISQIKVIDWLHSKGVEI